MYQQTILIGRIGQKELRYTKTQKPVIQYSVATSKSVKDKQTGNWTEYTEWHRLVSYNKCAEHIDTKLEPGQLIKVEGELRTRKWQDANGIDRYTTELVVEKFPLRLPSYFTRDGNNSDSGSTSSTNSSRQSMQQAAGQDFANNGPSFDGIPFDDDIPF